MTPFPPSGPGGPPGPPGPPGPFGPPGMGGPPGRPFLAPDQLRAVLNDAVTRQVARGWRVETHLDTQAVLAKGAPVNHVLHLLLTLLTCGLWLPVWVVLAIVGGEERTIVTVDPYGRVLFNGAPLPPGAVPGPARAPGPADPNTQAVLAASHRRELRRRAREQAMRDPVLAHELRIGRPDLPRQYDDGGLIDVNHVPPQTLLLLPDLTPEIADRIVRIREQIGGFTSAEELAATADLHPDLLPEIAEYGIFLR